MGISDEVVLYDCSKKGCTGVVRVKDFDVLLEYRRQLHPEFDPFAYDQWYCHECLKGIVPNYGKED